MRQAQIGPAPASIRKSYVGLLARVTCRLQHAGNVLVAKWLVQSVQRIVRSACFSACALLTGTRIARHR